jgi:hypothetical protein
MSRVLHCWTILGVHLEPIHVAASEHVSYALVEAAFAARRADHKHWEIFWVPPAYPPLPPNQLRMPLIPNPVTLRDWARQEELRQTGPFLQVGVDRCFVIVGAKVKVDVMDMGFVTVQLNPRLLFPLTTSKLARAIQARTSHRVALLRIDESADRPQVHGTGAEPDTNDSSRILQPLRDTAAPPHRIADVLRDNTELRWRDVGFWRAVTPWLGHPTDPHTRLKLIVRPAFAMGGVHRRRRVQCAGGRRYSRPRPRALALARRRS